MAPEPSPVINHGLSLGLENVYELDGLDNRSSERQSRPNSVKTDSSEQAGPAIKISNRRVSAISSLFLLGTILFSVASQLVESNKSHLARSYTGLLDLNCIDKLGDGGEPGFLRDLSLDFTFGNFTFTNAKIVDVAWDTAIGQGGRLLHGWVLYRCVMRRLLLYAMDCHCVTYGYYVTISTSGASLSSFWRLLRELPSVRGVKALFCTLMLVYALGYTLMSSVIWSAATGYTNFSHRLYPMPDATMVSLDSADLSLCWALDGRRFGWPEDRVEIGPDFSVISSKPAKSSSFTEAQLCLSDNNGKSSKNHSIIFMSGGWKVRSNSTIWDFFSPEDIAGASSNFRSIRSCKGHRVAIQHAALG